MSPRDACWQISFARFPYGGDGTAPFSYTMNITTKNLTRKTTSDVVLEPLLALAPPTLLIKCIGDMGAATAADTATGIRFSERYSYCTLANSCDPDYSIGKCWSWCVQFFVMFSLNYPEISSFCFLLSFIALYFLYSLLGLYFENIMPDAMVCKQFS